MVNNEKLKIELEVAKNRSDMLKLIIDNQMDELNAKNKSVSVIKIRNKW